MELEYTLIDRSFGFFMVVASFVASLAASIQIIQHKRDVRAAIGWLGFVWFAPFFGPLMYLLLGVNRISRRAAGLRRSRLPGESILRKDLLDSDIPTEPLRVSRPDIAHVVASITHLELTDGNHVTSLQNGDEAYPEMLEAIRNAKSSVSIMSYIFDFDPVGCAFVEALSDAQARGVKVRVLIDAAGSRYSPKRIDRVLRARGVTVARFLPFAIALAPKFNLRNHRKTLILDGGIVFTGGMNIRESHCLSARTKHPIQDLHFRFEGPVVKQLQSVFAKDWLYTTGERLDGSDWFPALHGSGTTLARAIEDGPDERIDAFRWCLLGGLASARHRIRVVTPYFLPDAEVATALNIAAKRGIEVDIVLPSQGNLAMIQWAMWGHIWRVLSHECRVWLTPPPFDHTKLLLIDDEWCLIGSANWDPRSLRLNFELNVEVYDKGLSTNLHQLVDEKIQSAKRVDVESFRAGPLWQQLRNSTARLFAPYL